MALDNHLADNTVKYLLFPIVNDGKINSTAREFLEITAENYVSKLSSKLKSYIWQSETFNLQVSEGEIGPHLEGLTCFGENIEDEWFIVYLLLELTKEDENLIVKIEDNDGEFLLMEAADHIPKWLNPDTSGNRVFLYRGSLHIIPKVHKQENFSPIPSGTPSILEAVDAIRQYSSLTRASSKVQEAIQKRIEGYPQKITKYQHRAHCYVPAAVAVILKEEPRLLSEAVKAFYLRTPLDIKACKAMKYFPPETRVMTEVWFTRCMYAQLLSQDFEPDKRTGWNLPPENSPLYKAHNLGMKLACGFEIIASNSPRQSKVEIESLAPEDLDNDLRWKRFLKSLHGINYFDGEIEGSKLHCKKLQEAKVFYVHSLEKNASSSPGCRVINLLEIVSINYEELKEHEKNLPEPDDDSWMNLTLDEFQNMLDAKLGVEAEQSEKKVAEALTSSLKAFMEHPSGVEGAEFPNSVSRQQNINFDAETFSEAMKNILDFKIPETDCCSSSSMSSYSDEGEEEIEEWNETGNPDYTKASNLVQDMKMYMDQMDRELASTAVGNSFERLPPSANAGSTMNSTAVEKPDDINDELDEFRPVDVDLTALKNILESYSNQHGLPGPASNLLASMGVHLPDDTEP